PGHRAEDDARLLAMVAEKLPPGITLELDGRYPAMFSYKMKTYALLDDRGRVTLKGSAFRSRGLEPFQRRLIDELVGLLLRGRRSGVARGRTRTWSITSPRCSRRGSASAASPSTTVSCRMSTRHRSRRS